MDFLDLARARRSVRKYSDRPVPRDAIERCLRAVRLAPSACNAQPWRFVVVDDPERRRQLARAAFGPLAGFNHFARQAPVLVTVVMERASFASAAGSLLSGKRFSLIDIGIAAAHFCLQAAELGLGTCMLGWFNQRKVKRFLSVPAALKAPLMISLGWPVPDTETGPSSRKTIERVRGYGGY